MEVGKQFGELPEDILEKIKYAKWRFVEICKAIKEKRTPAPPRGDPESAADDSAAGPSSDVPDLAPPPPPTYPGGGEPDYMGLPPPPPPVAAQTTSFEAPTPPQLPPQPPPAAFQPPPMPQVPPGWQPGRPAILEAMKLCQGAVSALQFQDAETAVHTLYQALQLLTTPTPGPKV